jgi:hypothetical protein
MSTATQSLGSLLPETPVVDAVKLPTPAEFTATVPSVFGPPENVTLPVGAPTTPLRVTVAFNVQSEPTVTALGVVVMESGQHHGRFSSKDGVHCAEFSGNVFGSRSGGHGYATDHRGTRGIQE